MNDEFIVKMIEELALEHNKSASFLDFIIKKLIEKDIITIDDLKTFLQNTEHFSISKEDISTINNVDKKVNEDNMLSKLEEEILVDKKTMIEKIFNS